MRRLIFLFLIIVSVSACQHSSERTEHAGHQQQEKDQARVIMTEHDLELGYLPAPEFLKGAWQNELRGEPILEFSEPNQYRYINAKTGHISRYASFKIFHITESGLAYTIKRSIENPSWLKDEEYQELSQQDLKEMIASGEAQYSYEIFDPVMLDPQNDLSTESDSSNLKVMRLYGFLCSMHLNRVGIKLNEEDFHRPAQVHWERVKPGGGCEYESFVKKTELRPKSSHYRTVYSKDGMSAEDLLHVEITPLIGDE